MERNGNRKQKAFHSDTLVRSASWKRLPNSPHVAGALQESSSPLADKVGACLRRSIVTARKCNTSSARLVLAHCGKYILHVSFLHVAIFTFQKNIISCVRVLKQLPICISKLQNNLKALHNFWCLYLIWSRTVYCIVCFNIQMFRVFRQPYKSPRIWHS